MFSNYAGNFWSSRTEQIQGWITSGRIVQYRRLTCCIRLAEREENFLSVFTLSQFTIPGLIMSYNYTKSCINAHCPYFIFNVTFCDIYYTDKKRISNFPHLSRNSEWSRCKVIYDQRPPYIWLCNCSTLNYLIYEENLISFYQCTIQKTMSRYQTLKSLHNINLNMIEYSHYSILDTKNKIHSKIATLQFLLPCTYRDLLARKPKQCKK